MLRFHGIPTEPGQIAQSLGTPTPAPRDMVRQLRERGLRARLTVANKDRLPSIPLPALTVHHDGTCILLAKLSGDRTLILDPASQRPAIRPTADFLASWTGQVILVARRAALGDLGRRFDIGWFVGAVQKYRWILGEVLAASFFLQIFALLSPLFFQVVIDKVLVHRGMATLDILVVGLVAIALFEAMLGTLRTYIFAHTTNRIDVELGARLFRHLLALPLPYFQARRVGDSVARVRELENIRNFLTSSALTLVIDLLFTGVFLAVMAVYSLN